ncbi:hypothetical protein BU17DRAFT_78748 [Hysterangium stoloniferum]|nr:hypothetical protein BU17DRAFT_78748 [Hysterangium stoloniferum]
MAMCSMAISIVSCAAKLGETPPWIKALKDNGIHSEWVEKLRRSCVSNLTSNIPWAGVLVHISNFHNPSLLPLMLANSVPIWYYWGQWSGKPLHSELKTVQQYCPTRKEVEVVIACPGQPATGSDENAVTPSTAPKPQVRSHQRQGETWQDFFKRQDARHAELEKNESLEKKQKRLDVNAPTATWLRPAGRERQLCMLG